MKGFPIAHIFHPSIPPMHAVVNNHNRNIDYWTVKRKFAEIVSTNDVNKIYSISNELRRVLSAITALNCHDPNPTGKYESIHYRYFYRRT